MQRLAEACSVGEAVLVIVMCTHMALAQEVVLHGVPSVKIAEHGTHRVASDLSSDQAEKWQCVVLHENGKYYWASREMKMLRVVRGVGYATYLTDDGSGYIRVREADPAEREGEFVEPYRYVEHLLLGLSSVTYYGHTRSEKARSGR